MAAPAEKTANQPKGEEKSAAPSISLPKGGGAIRGMGEKFAANPVTGTGSMSVPIATSPGRSGFGPQLSLSYDSGSGNGPFGFGWSLSIPSITRKTDKGLPKYRDADESDVFILSGAEDLVPVYRQDTSGQWVRDTLGNFVVHEDELDGYRVRRYRPRIEGLFARIERWTSADDSKDVHWRTISRDNILTLYGYDMNSRIADPMDEGRIFSWLICETRDDKGNGVLYRYKGENGDGVDLRQSCERNRGSEDDPARSANRYLKRIYYGNRVSLLNESGSRPRFLDEDQIEDQILNSQWMFEVVLDYGDHNDATPSPGDDEEKNGDGNLVYPWSHRSDPFSSYRSGFEVRTTRVCQRVLMFHHFPNEAEVGRDCLVRSTDFTYSADADPSVVDTPIYTFLRAVTQKGYRRNGDQYDARGLPPVEFSYSEAVVQETVELVDAESIENLPVGLDGGTYRWTDLHGEGIPGILTEQADAWFYKRNLSPIPDELPDGTERVAAKFSALETVNLKPAVTLRDGAEIMDLAGDGQPDVVVMSPPVPGLYEHDDDEGWNAFRPFESRLVRNFRDPNLKFIDIDGDGHTDVLITEDDALVWHHSLGEEGFGHAERLSNQLDEELGPRVIFNDGTQSVYLADLSGDGLTDIVRIRNGEVCYWPNLGHGKFGAKVTMDNAPFFDSADEFEQKRIRLADIDGSGTTDIIYLHRDGIRVYFNQSGNCWSRQKTLAVFPRVDEFVSITPVDLLGNGTACLVWSSSLPGDGYSPLRYVNLMGSKKPHLLISTSNNLGAETRVKYAPSTKFYLLDKRDGRPWITRLPFPVHVVEQVEIYDLVSRNRFVTQYTYHHGYFDGEEREFRGFGMVEQRDTEKTALSDNSGELAAAANLEAGFSVPPVVTKTWFHTGAYIDRAHISNYFAGLESESDTGEYFRESGLSDSEALALLLSDTLLPPGLTLDEEREACRSLKGSMLRQEVYADDVEIDATPEEIRRAQTPYKVTEQNFSIRALQRRGANRHGVYLTHTHETITFNYERDYSDPRIQHTLTLEADDYGNLLKQAAIGYGRRSTVRAVDEDGVSVIANAGLSALQQADQDKQTTTLVTYTENSVTNAVESSDAHRVPAICETLTFELTDYPATGAGGRFQDSDFVESDTGGVGLLRHRFSSEVKYEDSPQGDRCRRPIECVRTLYRRDELDGILPLGELQALGLRGEGYKLAFTPGLLSEVMVRDGEALIPDVSLILGGTSGNHGGYLRSQELKADGRFSSSDVDDCWWLPSGQSYFTQNSLDGAATELFEARQHFFLARRQRDPFGVDTMIDFDDYDLLMTETRDALDNRVAAEINDYRVLRPRLVSDANRNRTEVAYDTFGLVAGTAIMGKAAPASVEGDNLDGFVADVAAVNLDEFVEAPRQPSADSTRSEPTQIVRDLLQSATTRIVYDLERFMRLGEPAFAATIARETHVSDLLPEEESRIQVSLSYSDGFGREIQRKVLAEPGPLDVDDLRAPSINPRWVGSGWTIFNNKGKPVRQYEPFFSATHRFESNAIHGVSSVLFYDPVERAIATLHPNHTYEKVVFGPWRHATYDVNDCCAARDAQTGDPRTDPDIAGYLDKYFEAQPEWQTWYDQRITGGLGALEQTAAARAAAHADTPTVVHFDVLGRPFMTLSSNRVVCSGHGLDGTEENFATRTDLDIEGNQRVVRDERRLPVDYVPTGAVEQRVVMIYTYDMLGNRVCQQSMEAGTRWILNDVTGKPIRAWDSRGHNFVTSYDVLRRPTEQLVRGTTDESDPLTLNRDILVDKIEYGESIANAETLNLRTRMYRHFDSAGVVTNASLDADGSPTLAYDFKGNLRRSTRRLVSDYTTVPDWLLDPTIEDESFVGATSYDALNRPIQTIPPRSSFSRAKINVVQPVFNEANLLERLDVWLERPEEPDALLDVDEEAPSSVGVENIDYDEKGQRLQIEYKNGAITRYTYDDETFRLTRLYTRRGAGFTEDCDNPAPPPDTIAAPEEPPQGKACGLQNLQYTYDPVGNITNIRDDAQQTIYFRNQRVEPSNDYTYDALYRLIQATGREHLGQVNGARNPPTAPDAFNTFHTKLDQPGDGNAMGTYTERYVYDDVGNVLQVQHRGSDPAHAGWTRAYDYLETSLVEGGSDGSPARKSNRLSHTTLNPNGANPPVVEPYQHDDHGNMVFMPHLGGGVNMPNMHWDYKDRLRRADLGGGGIAYFVYNASGQRVLKVWEKSAGLVSQRIYLGGHEVFRQRGASLSADAVVLERDTLHVMDDKRRVALVETRTIDTASTDQAPRQLVRYQFDNHQGSATLEVDELAQIISYEEYTAYGTSTYQAMRSKTETAKRYRYTGRERDEETGFSHHEARFYCSWLGRWSAVDPGGLIDGANLYRYARGNPVVLNDPGGYQAEPAMDPQTVLIAATALQRAAQAWGSASIITGGLATAAPAVAATPLAAPAAESLALGGPALAASLAAAAAMGLALRLHMQRSASIVRFGNPWGMPTRDIAFPVWREIQRMKNVEPYPIPTPLPVPKPDEEPKEQKPVLGRVYATYTKYNAQTGQTYSGRTSMVIDLTKPWRPQAELAVANRDANHHINEDEDKNEPQDPTFGPAVLDQFAVGLAVDYRQRYRDVAYLAVRGREQQLIDYYGALKASGQSWVGPITSYDALGLSDYRGGARSDTTPPVTENKVRGVRKDSLFGKGFHEASNFVFGPLAPYTGDEIK